MATFNFKLERILNYKQTVETSKRNKFGIVQRKLHEEEAILDSYNEYKKTIIDEKNSANKFKAGYLAMYNAYINDLNDRIKRQQQKVQETEVELEKAKAEMIEAVKEKKIFEKLKENEYERYTYELKKQEEKLNDTIVSYKAATQQ
jgi:flagellar FliJ protein